MLGFARVRHTILFGQIHGINIVYWLWLAIHTVIVMLGIYNNLYNVLWLDLCVFDQNFIA